MRALEECSCKQDPPGAGCGRGLWAGEAPLAGETPSTSMLGVSKLGTPQNGMCFCLESPQAGFRLKKKVPAFHVWYWRVPSRCIRGLFWPLQHVSQGGTSVQTGATFRFACRSMRGTPYWGRVFGRSQVGIPPRNTPHLLNMSTPAQMWCREGREDYLSSAQEHPAGNPLKNGLVTGGHQASQNDVHQRVPCRSSYPGG